MLVNALSFTATKIFYVPSFIWLKIVKEIQNLLGAVVLLFSFCYCHPTSSNRVVIIIPIINSLKRGHNTRMAVLQCCMKILNYNKVKVDKHKFLIFNTGVISRGCIFFLIESHSYSLSCSMIHFLLWTCADFLGCFVKQGPCLV